MKIKLKYLFAFLSFLILTASCVKDNGNYEYIDLPSVEAVGFTVTSNGVRVLIGDNNSISGDKDKVLAITPNYEMSENINLKYEWTLIVKKQDPDNITPGNVISNSANLEYELNIDSGLYYLILVISNTDEDIEEMVKFNLAVQSINGIMVLYTNGTKGDISIFRTPEVDWNLPNDVVVIKNDLISDANGGNILNEPTILDIDYDPGVKHSIVTKDGVARYDIEFGFISNDYSLFESDHIPLIYAIESLNSYGGGYGEKFGFLVNSGKLLARTGPASWLYLNKFMKFNDDDYFPLVYMNDRSSFGDPNIIFNSTKKGFQELSRGYGYLADWGDQINYPTAIVHDNGAVEISNTEMDAISYGASGSSLTAIMKAEDNKIYSVLFSFPSMSAEDSKYHSRCLYKFDITNLVGTEDNTTWAFGTRGDYTFYGKDNILSVLSPSRGTVIDANANIPTDEEITKITVYENIKNEKYDGALIFVSTIKNGSEGTVYQFNINVLTGRPDIESKRVLTGFGEIKDVKVLRPL